MAMVNDKRLLRAGPIDPENGYPMWFEDSNKLRLELVLNVDPLAPVVGEFDPLSPLSIPGNFPDESFYFGAEAELPVGGAGEVGRARVILHLEAAFGGDGSPQRGMNVVFARIRVRMDKVISGARYIVTHPYGMTKELEADDRGRVFHTEDLGIVEGDPTAVIRSGQVAPFLAATVAPPAGYIADGGIEQAITGSPVELTPGKPLNYVVIEGPNIRAAGGRPDPNALSNMDRVFTDQFTLQGRIAKRLGAWVDRATYVVAGGGVKLTVAARSVAQAGGTPSELRVVGPGLNFKLQREGEDYVGIGSATDVPGPKVARLVNLSDTPPTWFPLTFEPELHITSASYDLDTKNLKFEVQCGDSAAVLQLVHSAQPDWNVSPHLISGLAAAPAVVEVVATIGTAEVARASQPVVITGTPVTSAVLEARATADPQVMEAGQALTLDGNASAAAVSYAWTQTAGPGTAQALLAKPGEPLTQATPPANAPGNYSFTLTVTGNDGTQKSVEVGVTAKPRPNADTIVVDKAEYRTRNRQFRISGSVNNLPNRVFAKLGGVQIGEPATADGLGNWKLIHTLKATDAAPVPNAAVELTGRIGNPVTQTILIKN